jgi:replicative DNA helicase
VNYSVSEKAVLSACLADETHLSSAIALESLTEEDFTSPARQAIFALIAKQSDVNEVDVAIELPQYASEAIELSEMHGGGRVDRYVEHLVTTRNRRIAEKALFHGLDALKNPVLSVEEVAGTFNMQVAKALSQGKGQVQVGKAVKEAYSEFLAIDAGDSSAISTGFTKLDYALEGGGFMPGKLYCIGARPGVGKSALAIHFSHEIAKLGYRVAYASLEMSASECSGRLLTRESRVARPRTKEVLLPAHKKRLEDATKRMTSWPITFKDDNQATLDSFRAFLAQERVKGDVGLAVIDYLQLLSAPGHDSRVQEVSHISRSLKQISMELQVPILALSQLNRQLESQNRKPILSDLRESGSIEQDCDAAFLVSKEEELDATRDKIRFHVAKNRGGETDQTIFLTFEKSLGSFEQFSTPSLNNEKPAF